ncbi:hypothetical protein [Empedobacter brevis]|uniref:hypothetical protein n=1 Tax=Empedobacter brevis TaxID=247 RepID=UPI00131F8435|nr:hypothetical protein [Empedobacter brevis]QHC84619.1 hypothetical protein AS589_07370 [Empedobacter brevis]
MKKDSISICLNCYKIKFNKKGTPTEKNAQSVFGSSNVVKIAQRYIKMIDLKKVYKTNDESRILYLKSTLKVDESKNFYAGIIMKGHNGPQTNIDELIGSEVKTVNTVSKDQYHCLPYVFLLYINPNNPDDIIFIAQSYRQYGFKEIFEESFKAYVSGESSETNVKFNSLSLASVFEKNIQEGLIKGLRFVKHGLIQSAESVIKDDKNPKSDYTMELAIKSRSGFCGIKKDIKYNDASFIEQVKIDGFDYDEALADIIVAGRKRVINITKPLEFSTSYDITEDVEIDINTKLPNFDDVLKQTLDILENDLIPYL